MTASSLIQHRAQASALRLFVRIISKEYLNDNVLSPLLNKTKGTWINDLDLDVRVILISMILNRCEIGHASTREGSVEALESSAEISSRNRMS